MLQLKRTNQWPMCISLYMLLFILLIIPVISTCYNPSESDKGERLSRTVAPPYNVVAEQGEYFIKVNWLDPVQADYYTVLKNVNDTGWVEDTSLLHSKVFNDYEHKSGNKVVYKIKSTVQGRSSGLSDVSNVIMGDPTGTPPDAPTDVEAFSEPGRVFIRWEYSPNADYYLIFRKYGDYNWQPLTNHSLIQVNGGYDEDPVDYPVVYYGVKAMCNDLYSDLAVTVLNCTDCPTPPEPTTVPTPVRLEGEVLEVISFAKENVIRITWSEIPGTDAYAVLRDTDATGAFTQRVYEGTGTGFNDTDFSNNQFYYYRLALLDSSGAIQSTSDYSFGMGSAAKADIFEPNDIPEDAVILNQGINTGNIYCFKDAFNNTLLDTDCYYLELDPRESKTITITGLDTITGYQDLYLTRDSDSEPVAIGEGDGFILNNNEDTVQQVYFTLSVNTQTYINEFGTYRIIVE